MELNEIIEKIDNLKNEIDPYRPISPEIEKRIWQKYRLDWNFHSNNLEGNSLTFGETKSFLLHGITAEGKPLKDHLDIKGHNEAILLLDDIIKHKRPLTETFIRELHETILHEPYERPAITADGSPSIKRIEIGQYKKTANHVKTATGEIFYFASPEETPAKMNDLMDWYQRSIDEKELHPLIIASEFHYRFVTIHPFDDGNGRMARLLMNLILMQFHFPPVIIKTGDKINYFRALQLADGGNHDAFYSYIGEQLISSEELFLKGAKGNEIQDADDVDKEISLLKARLQQESQKIILEKANIDDIFENSVTPLFFTIYSKINQFDELFNKKSISLDYIRSDKSRVGIDYTESYEGAINQLKKFLNTNFSIKNYSITNLWIDFIKTDNKNFNVKSVMEISFKNFEFVINVREADTTHTFNILYHKKNDEVKFQKIANTIAKGVLNMIENELSKE